MPKAPETLEGLSLKWTGRHHSVQGDFHDLSTHTVTYQTPTDCYVTSGGELVGEALYTYLRLDDRMAICIYRPHRYQGRDSVVLNAMFDFEEMTDRAVITASGDPFAIANGSLTFVEASPGPETGKGP